MHGNVLNWCQDGYEGDYAVPKGGEAVEDKEDSLQIVSIDPRVLRGGSFLSPAVYLRSASRSGDVPPNRYNYIGFRPARTIRP
jgi:formylglycine-generating enzyme required for sulfatase activity